MKLQPMFGIVTRFAAIAAIAAALAAAALASGGSSPFHRDTDAYLGVDFENLNTQQRTSLHLDAKEGVAIAAVDHDAPAGTAGLCNNDIIIAINGVKAHSAEQLRHLLHQMTPGQTVTLDLIRQGRALQVSVQLANRHDVEQNAWATHYTVPAPNEVASAQRTAPQAQLFSSTSPSASQRTSSQASSQAGFLGSVPAEIGKSLSSNGAIIGLIPGTAPYTGIVLDPLNSQLASYFGVKSTGLLVKSVDANSPGSRAGLQAGDVVLKVNGKPMSSRGKWAHIIRQNRHDALKLDIFRDRRPQTLTLTLAETKS